MPRFTENYRLGFRGFGEQISASLESYTFNILDNQLAFLADVVGDGVIAGWAIEDLGDYQLSVSEGYGVVDRFLTRSFGPLDVTIPDDGVYYLFIQRTLGVLAGFSSYSNQVSHTHEDETEPSVPTGLSWTSRTYNSISLSWSSNTEVDFDHYNLYRSTDNTASGWAAVTAPIAEIEANSYSESGLESDTWYYYRLKSVDLTGNESSGYDTVSVITLEDDRIPADPETVTLYETDSIIQVTWNRSPSNYTSGYRVTLQQVSSTGIPIGSPSIYDLSSDSRNKTLAGLTNGLRYQITVQSFTATGQFSAGIAVTGIPVEAEGPNEVQSATAIAGYDGTRETISVSWTPPASDIPVDYLISVIEPDGTESVSTLVSGSISTTLYSYQVLTGSGLNTKQFQELTIYRIRVKGRNSSGAANAGIIASATTGKHSSPNAPTSVAIDLYQNDGLRVSWMPPSDYDHFTITLISTYGDVATTLVDEENLGRTTVWFYTDQTVQPFTTYEAHVTAYDAYGNASASGTDSYDTEVELERPAQPTFNVRSNVGSAIITWSPPNIENIREYRIYRATYSSPSFGTFDLIATVDADVYQFVDHAVQALSVYDYGVTVVDSYGNESPGPATDEPFITEMVRPSENSVMSAPSNLSISTSGADVTLTWDYDADFFDGYQIMMSAGNKYQFEAIGTVNAGATTYTYTNALLQGGVTYTYMIRKYRNECSLLLQDSPSLPEHAVLIGRIEMASGAADINTSHVVNIMNAEDAILAKVEQALAGHRHTYRSDIDDRRIELGSTWTIDDWTTNDQINWYTEHDVSSVSDYAIYINDLPVTMLFEFSPGDQRITFEQPLNNSDTIKLIAQDMEETQGTLPARRIREINAHNITTGQFDFGHIPDISHRGRIGETLIPVGSEAVTSDRVYFQDARPISVSQASRLGTTFFDITGTETSGKYLAATSRGVLISENYGVSWDVAINPTYPVRKVFYSQYRNMYLAIAGPQVFTSEVDKNTWSAQKGLGFTSIIRDVCDDLDGNIYLSTNQGVYILDADVIEKRWVRRPLPSPRSGNCYTIFYDSTLSGIVVGTEIGMFYSANKGSSWTYWTAFRESRSALSSARNEDDLFILTRDTLYHKTDADSTFSPVYKFDNHAYKMVIFRGKIYVSTEGGLMSTTADEENISFSFVFPEIGEGGRPNPVYAINTSENRLLLGTDHKMFVSTSHQQATLQWLDRSSNRAPTIYVEGQSKHLGTCFNDGYFSLNDPLELNKTCTIVRDYDTYYAKEGGWAGIAPQALVSLYVNRRRRNDPDLTSHSDYSSLFRISMDVPTIRNSVYDKALPVYQAITGIIDSHRRVTQIGGGGLTSSFTPLTSQEVKSLVTKIGQLRSCTEDSYSISIPETTTLLGGGVSIPVNPITGTFNLTSLSLGKHTHVSVDLVGTTFDNADHLSHQELQDTIDKHQSGLATNLAHVLQVNVLKNNMFIEDTWEGEREENAPSYQSGVMRGCDADWYDSLKSSVDHTLRIRKDNENKVIVYPSSVLYVPEQNEVWVSGEGGVIAISTSDYTVRAVSGTNGFIKQLIQVDDHIYAVSDQYIYESVLDGSFARYSTASSSPINSIIYYANALILGCADGVYVDRGGEEWEKTFSISEAHVYKTGDTAVMTDTNGGIYLGNSPETWTRKGALVGSDSNNLILKNVSKYRWGYWATDQGLYEDLGTLYSDSIRLSPVNIQTSSTSDVYSDGNIIVSSQTNGRYWIYGGTSWTEYDHSSDVSTIYKALLVDGGVWIFGLDRVKIVDSNITIQLATGSRVGH